MARFISVALDKCSQMLVNHTGWAYLDQMEDQKQLKVIQDYNRNESKYVVVVFERNEEPELNQEDSGFHKEEMEEEWLENNP